MEPQQISSDVTGSSRSSEVQAARPPWWGIDRDPERRPGRLRADPMPMPNVRFPPDRQQNESSVPKHGRPGKPFPPVFSSAMPLHGLSGVIKRFAYSMPDHKPAHWLTMMLGDRVESMEHRARTVLPFALPVAGLAAVVWLLRD